MCFRKAHSLLLTKPPLSAPSLQPISILPSTLLKTQTNPKRFFVLQMLDLPPLPCSILLQLLKVSLCFLITPSSLKKAVAPHHHYTKTACLEAATATLAFLAQWHCCYWSFSPWTKSSPLPFMCQPVLGISEGSLLSSRKSWHSLEEGIQMRISPLPFQRDRYEPGPIYQGIKLPTGTPIHSSISSNCERFWVTQGSTVQRYH